MSLVTLSFFELNNKTNTIMKTVNNTQSKLTIKKETVSVLSIPANKAIKSGDIYFETNPITSSAICFEIFQQQ
ncbi:hypothetical protein DXN05_06150 [Deminuibacter soli]|uniref:Uncharacterized protein n=2 Tax=Deminuibacter soli TaxID=2291815 RepID=A0A3E1NRI8_9BACT|nr:hypothetical protein DXN05_06150 [Deminuibacter soli]